MSKKLNEYYEARRHLTNLRHHRDLYIREVPKELTAEIKSAEANVKRLTKEIRTPPSVPTPRVKVEALPALYDLELPRASWEPGDIFGGIIHPEFARTQIVPPDTTGAASTVTLEDLRETAAMMSRDTPVDPSKLYDFEFRYIKYTKVYTTFHMHVLSSNPLATYDDVAHELLKSYYENSKNTYKLEECSAVSGVEESLKTGKVRLKIEYRDVKDCTATMRATSEQEAINAIKYDQENASDRNRLVDFVLVAAYPVKHTYRVDYVSRKVPDLTHTDWLSASTADEAKQLVIARCAPMPSASADVTIQKVERVPNIDVVNAGLKHGDNGFSVDVTSTTYNISTLDLNKLFFSHMNRNKDMYPVDYNDNERILIKGTPVQVHRNVWRYTYSIEKMVPLVPDIDLSIDDGPQPSDKVPVAMNLPEKVVKHPVDIVWWVGYLVGNGTLKRLKIKASTRSEALMMYQADHPGRDVVHIGVFTPEEWSELNTQFKAKQQYIVSYKELLPNMLDVVLPGNRSESREKYKQHIDKLYNEIGDDVFHGISDVGSHVFDRNQNGAPTYPQKFNTRYKFRKYVNNYIIVTADSDIDAIAKVKPVLGEWKYIDFAARKLIESQDNRV